VDARDAQRWFDIDATKPSMGVGRTNETGVQHARQLHVIDKAPTPGKQCRIFKPLHTCTKMFRAHPSAPQGSLLSLRLGRCLFEKTS
jgi:hypothetical protein